MTTFVTVAWRLVRTLDILLLGLGIVVLAAVPVAGQVVRVVQTN